MKGFKFLTLAALSSFTLVNGAFFDSVKCLPLPESGEKLFPLCKEVYGNVELLYWTVEEGALDYSISMKEPDFSFLPNHYASGKVNRATFEWNPGVRVLIGFYNAPKYWELFGQYTYFQDYGHDKAHKPDEDDLYLNGTFPQISDQFAGTFLTKAKSYIRINYQIADVLFARVFDPNPHLRMRLIAGVTGAFIDQKWQVGYRDNDDSFTAIKNEWRFNSGGLRLGISADWWWKWHLYFSGKASFAGYAGRYTNHSTIKSDFNGLDPEEDIQNIRYKDFRYVQHMQLLLGPSWHCVGRSYHWEVFLGYELNGWFNLQEVYRSQANTVAGSKTLFQNTGAIALQGVTLRATLGF